MNQTLPTHRSTEMTEDMEPQRTTTPRSTAFLGDDGRLEFTHDGTTRTTEHASTAAAREAALAEMVALAALYGRPLELTTEGAEGAWDLVVRPDGSVAPVGTEGARSDPFTEPTEQSSSRDEDLPLGTTSATAPTTDPVGSSGPVDERDRPDEPHEEAGSAPGPSDAGETSADLDVTIRTRPLRPEESDVPEETVLLAPRRSAVVHRATLHTSSGTTLVIHGDGVLGRRPRGAANCVRFDDPHRSVSNSHLRFVVEEDAVRITDLGSSNGTTVVHEGVETVCEPGVEVRVLRGARVEVGSVFFVIV
ncbi:hypothetical protein BIU98_10365 [Curtobacterium sp. MMLR14_010]|uniref:FHA domain-containing protein n=1 Tax=Curtobacterium sp. MMLR14_010 TaxID=1898743 RepID=UPI0008DD63C0|nr:FHA domain-containing protein [Curtobacterium sp. MMLR14_010]OII39482.1 hypothetical protein BIU98_10365 [Curtobacterium sp. MMLR14_010]